MTVWDVPWPTLPHDQFHKKVVSRSWSTVQLDSSYLGQGCGYKKTGHGQTLRGGSKMAESSGNLWTEQLGGAQEVVRPHSTRAFLQLCIH